MNKFADRLKELRTEKGMLQKDLAEKVGVSRVTVTSWEQGRNEPPYDTLVSIAAVFEVSADYLLGITDI